jgi:curved DNA-binding protein CbpA
MPDHFAVLAQPRRPWLDEGALKEAFHRATAQHHPDLAGGSGEMAAALNAAYAILREPAARLKHLLELEVPAALQVRAAIAPELGAVFGKIAVLRQKSAAYEKKNTLARALAMEEGQTLRTEIEATLAALGKAESAALEELRALDARWEERDPQNPALVATLQQHFAYLSKWQGQLREDLFRLGG